MRRFSPSTFLQLFVPAVCTLIGCAAMHAQSGGQTETTSLRTQEQPNVTSSSGCHLHAPVEIASSAQFQDLVFVGALHPDSSEMQMGKPKSVPYQIHLLVFRTQFFLTILNLIVRSINKIIYRMLETFFDLKNIFRFIYKF